MADHSRQKTVVIADYDYGNVDIERAIIEEAGLRLATAQCKSEDDVIAVARDADAIIAQYATVGAKAISALTRCEVIARYGTGTDIVDVDAATRARHPGHERAERLVRERGRRPRHGSAPRRRAQDLWI